MTDSNKHYEEFLQTFITGLNENGFATQLEGASAERVHPELLVQLSGDEQNPTDYIASFTIIPGMEEQLEDHWLLQCFVQMSEPLEKIATEALTPLILRLNTVNPLVGFTFFPAEKVLAFRHTFLVAREADRAAATVLETTWIISYLLNLFGQPLLAVAKEEHTTAEAFRDHPYADLII